MLTIFLAIAAAYFFGLGFMGFLFVFGLLQIKREHGKLSSLAMAILSGLNYCLVMGAIFALATLYGKYKADVTDEVGWTYAITFFVIIGLVYVLAKEWNRLLLKEKRN